MTLKMSHTQKPRVPPTLCRRADVTSQHCSHTPPTMSFTVSATAARAVASPAFVSKASSKVRFVSVRFHRAVDSRRDGYARRAATGISRRVVLGVDAAG